MDSTRALLDELMGKDRNVPLSQKKVKELRFTDSIVCKYELAGLCPFTLFKNTKSDLGTCQYELHKDNLDWEKVGPQWEALSDREKMRYGYERELFRYLDTLVKDMDRKVARGKERAEKESAPRELKPEEHVQLETIQEKLKEALDKAEQMGDVGDVDQSMIYSQQADTLKAQYDDLYKTFTTPERTMTVCEVCGVFINSTDNEQRRRDHLNGKQYQGWKSIRDERDRLADRMDLYRKIQDDERQQQEESMAQVEEKRIRERSRSRELRQSETDERERYRRRERSRSPRRRYPEEYRGAYDDRRRGYDDYRRRSRYEESSRRSRY